jgi:hypothetical protein
MIEVEPSVGLMDDNETSFIISKQLRNFETETFSLSSNKLIDGKFALRPASIPLRARFRNLDNFPS